MIKTHDEYQRAISRLTTGCYISAHEGWRGVGLVVLLAQSLGYPVSPDDESLLAAFLRGDPMTDDGQDSVYWLSDDAERWLNDCAEHESATWYWNDGDFGLWADYDEWGI